MCIIFKYIIYASVFFVNFTSLQIPSFFLAFYANSLPILDKKSKIVYILPRKNNDF